jgi:putative flippase GtrA
MAAPVVYPITAVAVVSGQSATLINVVLRASATALFMSVTTLVPLVISSVVLIFVMPMFKFVAIVVFTVAAFVFGEGRATECQG